MRILLIHNSYRQPGGEDVVFEQEAALLLSAGHHVHVIRRSNHELRLNTWVEQARSFGSSIWSNRNYDEVAGILRRERFDVAHVHNTQSVISPSVLWACRKYGVPVVQTLHNYRLFCPAATFYKEGKVCEECLSHGLHRAVHSACFQGSRTNTTGVVANIAFHRAVHTWRDAVHTYIALAPFAKQKFAEAGIPSGKIVVKPNFVSPDPGYSEECGEYAIFVGRLTPEKGVHTLLAAMPKLKRPIRLVIVGDGPERNRIEEQIRALRLADITMMGQQPRSATLRLIRHARLLIFPSEWYETFGLTMVEAMACGVPVIASRIGVVSDAIVHGKTGLLFTPGDPVALAQTIENAWDDADRMLMLARNARREYEEKYTAERNLQQLTSIYTTAASTAAAA